MGSLNPADYMGSGAVRADDGHKTLMSPGLHKLSVGGDFSYFSEQSSTSRMVNPTVQEPPFPSTVTPLRVVQTQKS